MELNPLVELLENWLPGIGESTAIHDELHCHFHLDFSVRSEARLLGFQLGHHPASNVFHVLIFIAMSTTIYPSHYRNGLKDIKEFYKSYLFGKHWQSVPYWFIPRNILL
jgi:hypothetical protein